MRTRRALVNLGARVGRRLVAARAHTRAVDEERRRRGAREAAARRAVGARDAARVARRARRWRVSIRPRRADGEAAAQVEVRRLRWARRALRDAYAVARGTRRVAAHTRAVGAVGNVPARATIDARAEVLVWRGGVAGGTILGAAARARLARRVARRAIEQRVCVPTVGARRQTGAIVVSGRRAVGVASRTVGGGAEAASTRGVARHAHAAAVDEFVEEVTGGTRKVARAQARVEDAALRARCAVRRQRPAALGAAAVANVAGGGGVLVLAGRARGDARAVILERCPGGGARDTRSRRRGRARLARRVTAHAHGAAAGGVDKRGVAALGDTAAAGEEGRRRRRA